MNKSDRFRYLGGIGAAILIAISLSFFEPQATTINSTEVGGFRAFAADVKWIGAYHAWQNHDALRLQRELAWATRLAPSNMLYWLDGARMLGYDVAAWRRTGVVERAEVTRINRAALELAQAHLARGEEWHPQKAALPIEEAIMQLRLVGDTSRAEQSLARAQGCADAPFFVARVRAELLVKLGREREALALLESELDRLQRSDPRAMVEVVELRIGDLRARLGDSG